MQATPKAKGRVKAIIFKRMMAIYTNAFQLYATARRTKYYSIDLQILGNYILPIVAQEGIANFLKSTI